MLDGHRFIDERSPGGPADSASSHLITLAIFGGLDLKSFVSDAVLHDLMFHASCIDTRHGILDPRLSDLFVADLKPIQSQPRATFRGRTAHDVSHSSLDHPVSCLARAYQELWDRSRTRSPICTCSRQGRP